MELLAVSWQQPLCKFTCIKCLRYNFSLCPGQEMQHRVMSCGTDVLVTNTGTLWDPVPTGVLMAGPCGDSLGSSLAGGFVSQFCALQILILRVSYTYLILCTKCLQYSPQSGITPQVRSGTCFFSGSGKLQIQFPRRSNSFHSVPGYWYILVGKLILVISLISLNKVIFRTLCSIIPIIYHYLIIQKHYHQHRRFTK